jgi:spore germination cell wall hydrolase CwlJ-like protein
LQRSGANRTAGSALDDLLYVTRPAAPATRAFARADSDRWGRRLVMAGCLVVATLFVGVRVVSSAADANDYSVTVPVTLRPHDPALWALVNAGSFEAAQAMDASLPDPASIPGLSDTAALPAPPDMATLRQQIYTGPPATRYVFRGRTALDTTRAHYCLTAALYYEAASESDDGMRGVAQVVLNRVRHPSFPGSVCGVVFQGSQRAGVCQFTFACDGAMARAPSRTNWARASRIAAEALAGRVFEPVGVATHYHTLAVWPSWGRSLAMTNVVGAHIFHRWRGRWGTPGAFSRPYAGREPVPGPYLPVAAQLAARAGQSTSAVTGAVDPATMATIGTTPAPLPGATGQPQPGFASTPATPARPAPSYADPRLAGSGTVREEFKNSGTAIR